MLRKHPKIFQDPHIDYPIYDFHLDFSDYIKQSEQIIANTRQDLQQHPELTIKSNTPFELRPNNPNVKSGALLVHGLLDSPFIMRDIGDYLQSQGLLVRSIMLPGHGTVPGALLNVQYDEWLQAVNYGIATLKRDVENIFLVGFSTGATVSIYSAMQNPDITGLVLIAPALKINSPFTFLSNWDRFVAKKWDRAKWFYLGEEIDYVKYQSLPFNAIYQVYQLGLALQKSDLKKPLFMALSNEDKIVCSKTSMNYFQQNPNSLNRVLIYSSKPLFFSDERITIRNSAYPDMNILNFCHITLPVAPNNFHYGKEGDYVHASHIQKNVRYGSFDKADSFFYDMLRRLKLTSFEYERLTFNPDFEFMQNQMGKFIKSVSARSAES